MILVYRGELEQFDPYWLERMYAEWEEYEQYVEYDEMDMSDWPDEDQSDYDYTEGDIGQDGEI